ncbi:acetate/propionate family kinase [Stappia sp.]|uniref:acetate/propionate family kinase n=1 Tax=Stappia sp. TaxID=1870903 RepID=UPI003A995EA7
MSDAILTLNAGSSSIKLAIFDLAPDGRLSSWRRGDLRETGDVQRFRLRDADGAGIADETWNVTGFEASLSRLTTRIGNELAGRRLAGIGHRVVHGGAGHRMPERVTPDLLDMLEELAELAPLHVPHNLAPIRAIARDQPDIPQVVCFDTAFHRTMMPVARRFALPRSYEARGIRRYGFHGLSYEYIARQLAALSPRIHAGRVIVAHLGSGASMCAMRGGTSVDTTMGFTALDGLVMGTRCGTLDPGALLHVMRQDGLDVDAMERLLYTRSGLLGMSGISNDMQVLLESRETAASEAIDVFVYRIVREVGALASVLGGLDALVFTAGIGENSPEIRERTCGQLGWLGLDLDAAANRRGAAVISTPESRVEVRVIATDEEAMIAEHVRDLPMLAGDPVQPAGPNR